MRSSAHVGAQSGAQSSARTGGTQQMTQTTEQRAAYDWFRSVVASRRLRVVADAEGFPIAPGRYGQVEWHAEGVVAIFSQTVRMLAKLLAVPGVRRHQIGDGEFRLLLTVE